MLAAFVLFAVVVLVALVLRYRSGATNERQVPATEHPSATDDDIAGATDEPVVLAIEDSIDLHTFAPRDIPSVVESYLEAAAERGFEQVRLIHGRGKGVQRARVRQVLLEHPAVAHFEDAPPSRGGYGATLVWLKRSVT